jgi:hypothetical protein
VVAAAGSILDVGDKAIVHNLLYVLLRFTYFIYKPIVYE